MKRILVGIDGSARADGVLAYAESFARVTGATLLLVRAIGIPADMALAWPCSDEALQMAMKRQAQEYLETCAKRLASEVFAEVRVLLGIPWRAVCQAARDDSVDLIVVGSHGYGGIDRLIGTTAATIVNHADRSVLVVRGPW